MGMGEKWASNMGWTDGYANCIIGERGGGGGVQSTYHSTYGTVLPYRQKECTLFPHCHFPPLFLQHIPVRVSTIVLSVVRKELFAQLYYF